MNAGTQFLTDANGAKVAAVIPIGEYEELMEDLEDLAIVAERRDEPSVSSEDVKRRLEEDRVVSIERVRHRKDAYR